MDNTNEIIVEFKFDENTDLNIKELTNEDVNQEKNQRTGKELDSLDSIPDYNTVVEERAT